MWGTRAVSEPKTPTLQEVAEGMDHIYSYILKYCGCLDDGADAIKKAAAAIRDNVNPLLKAARKWQEEHGCGIEDPGPGS